jgi:transposase
VKYGAHLPLNRQSDIYAHEGIDLDVTTLAHWVGTCAATLMWHRARTVQCRERLGRLLRYYYQQAA